MDNINETTMALLIDRLTRLEYEIRKSMAVREDQEENANPQHKDEAERCGIPVEDLNTKGELLNVVQTAVRATQARVGRNLNREKL